MMQEKKMTAAQMPEKVQSQRKKTNSREITFQVQARQLEGEEKEKMIVEGYAVRFNSPTVLFEYDGHEYREQIDDKAFEEAKMDDVIFNYNHAGKVMARTRNGTLTLEVRSEGLFIRAELGGTEEGRKLYEEIKGGYIDRMSFRFSIREEAYDKENRMWTVRRVKRLYDVSAVDIPAYDDTSIEARKDFILEAQEKRKREAAAELRKRKLILKTKLLKM
ncbi:MAG: HK97 family phage prohead protease [Butyrivibrio sp.]|nr:HK97 family phage prohead protease [Acetatifactor muris]MCM1560954.1 HK97 family phage prohead protease [Butyrivibrio sp.]